MDVQVLKASGSVPLHIGTTGAMAQARLLTVGRDAAVAVGAREATVWICLRGSAEVSVSGGALHLAAGQWLCLDGSTPPALHTGRYGVVLGIVLPPALHEQLMQAASGPLLPGSGTASQAQLRTLLSAWRAVTGRERAPRQDVDRWQLLQLLRTLAPLQRDFDALVERCPGRSLRRRRQLFVRLQRARLHLEANLHNALRIRDLAPMSNMSVWYFTKTFTTVYGQTPQAMCIGLRLQRARVLLCDERLSVAEVGAACGFENNCSFSRAFRTQYGMPPSLYRLYAARNPASAVNDVITACQSDLKTAV